jgi:hypothetical protein
MVEAAREFEAETVAKTELNQLFPEPIQW